MDQVTVSRELLRQVLNALSNVEVTGPDDDGLVWINLPGNGTTGKAILRAGKIGLIAAQCAKLFDEQRVGAIAALRTALEQPAVEPAKSVKRKTSDMHTAVRKVLQHHGLTKAGDAVVEADLIYAVLAAAPQAQPAPEINQCDGCRMGQELRNGLHFDRNGTAQMTCQAHRYKQPAPVQEPVARYIGESPYGSIVQLYDDLRRDTDLYTAPQAQPAPVQEPVAILESVICDPSGKCSIKGSDADRAIVDAALTALRSEVVGCFDAALHEGLMEALAETTDDRLKDLVERRLMHAFYAAQQPAPVQEPYGWHVTGGNELLRGEYAQIDAELAAKRCGGTAKAVAVYTAPQAQPAAAWPAHEHLSKVLAAVLDYLPPDGITKDEFINRVIACVDPWPESQAQQPAVNERMRRLTPTELQSIHHANELGRLCALEDSVKLAPVVEASVLKKNGVMK